MIYCGQPALGVSVSHSQVDHRLRVTLAESLWVNSAKNWLRHLAKVT